MNIKTDENTTVSQQMEKECLFGPRCTQCTLYSVHCTVYSTQCTLYSTQCTVHRTQCTVHSIQYTVYRTHCTVHSVQYTVYTSEYMQIVFMHNATNIANCQFSHIPFFLHKTTNCYCLPQKNTKF